MADIVKKDIFESLRRLSPKEVFTYGWITAVRCLIFAEPKYETIQYGLKWFYNVVYEVDYLGLFLYDFASYPNINKRSFKRTYSEIDEPLKNAFSSERAMGSVLDKMLDNSNNFLYEVLFRITKLNHNWEEWYNKTKMKNDDTLSKIYDDVYALIMIFAKYYHLIGSRNISDNLLFELENLRKYEVCPTRIGEITLNHIWNDKKLSFENVGLNYWYDICTKLIIEGMKLNDEEFREAMERRVNVPGEIRAQGAIVVAGYLRQIDKQGSERLNEARLIILGDKGAGKTCLARRLIDISAPMTSEDESTDGVVTTLWRPQIANPDDAKLNIHIWDFAGHVVTHAAHRCFLSERCLYVIVYDGRSEMRNQLEYWLEHVKLYGGNAPVYILVNLRDYNPPEIAKNTLKKKYKNIIAFYELSIDSDINELARFRDVIASAINNNPSWNTQQIPMKYFTMKKLIEQRFHPTKQVYSSEFIPKDAFDNMSIENGIDTDDIHGLLAALHHLGVCLWYPDLEGFDTLVLNPDWITHAIYKMINWARRNDCYVINLADYEKVFVDETRRYPKNKLLFLFRLMQKYELAYSKNSEQSIVIPYLLKMDEPIILPDHGDDSLLIEFVAEQVLPPDTISRFIVRHHEEILTNSDVWRYGVILHYSSNTEALVLEFESEKRISISVKGTNKTEYLKILRSSMNDIFSSYQTGKPEMHYRIITQDAIVGEPNASIFALLQDDKPIMLPEGNVMAYIQKGVPHLDPFTQLFYSMIPTAKAYGIEVKFGDVHVHIENPQTQYGNNAIMDNHSVNQSISFYDCNVQMQNDVLQLARRLKDTGYDQEATALEAIYQDLEEVESVNDPKEISENNKLGRIRSFIQDLQKEDSNAARAIKNVRKGIELAQNIAKKYNDIAQWAGWPQVPRPFLGKES